MQCLALYLYQLCINHLNIISLILTIPVVRFSGRASTGLSKLQSQPLLVLLQFGDLVLKVEDAEMQVLVLVLELFDIRRVFLSLPQISDLSLFLLALSLELDITAL